MCGSGEEGGKSERDAPVYGQQEGVHCQDQGQHHDDYDDDDDGRSQDDDDERAKGTSVLMMTRKSMNNRVWNIISTQWINPLPSCSALFLLTGALHSIAQCCCGEKTLLGID